eukprot:COSAG01_NODE_2638_length_7292_cov_8.034034_4_plen_68_part_00
MAAEAAAAPSSSGGGGGGGGGAVSSQARAMDAAEMQRALARETEAMRHERELITAVRRGEAWATRPR